MTKVVKEHIGLHYLLIEKQLYTLILLDSFFLYSSRSIEKNKDKSITHSIFRIQGNESIICEFHYFALIEYDCR